MPPPPPVSIVLPFRNEEAFLAECLDSIRQQTLVDFELLAIDDGSEDGSARIVRRYAEEDDRIRLIQPGRVGLVGALNLGIAEARGGLIARMDADDVMRADRLAAQKAYLESNPEVALVACRVELFPDDVVQGGYREYVRWQNGCVDPDEIAANLYVESPFAHPSVMVRREAVRAVGGYRDGEFPEDYELWLRMHAAGMRMAKLPRVLLAWRERERRTSRTDARYGRDAFDRLRADYLARDPRLGGGRPVVVWGAGRRTRLRARLLMERGVRIEGWIDVDPAKIGRPAWGLPVHPPEWLDAAAPRPFVLVYVTSRGARELIADDLARRGFRVGDDFLAVG